MPCWSILCYSLAFLQGKVWNVVLENSLKPFDHPTPLQAKEWNVVLENSLKPFDHPTPLVSEAWSYKAIQSHLFYTTGFRTTPGNSNDNPDPSLPFSDDCVDLFQQNFTSTWLIKKNSEWLWLTIILDSHCFLRTVTAPTDCFFKLSAIRTYHHPRSPYIYSWPVILPQQ